MEESKEENKTSIINESDAKLSRISSLQSDANYFQIAGDFVNWKSTLNCLYLEIYAKLSSKERQDLKDMMSDCGIKLSRYITTLQMFNRGEHMQFSPNNKWIFDALFTLDSRTRELVDIKGFASPNKPDNPKTL